MESIEWKQKKEAILKLLMNDSWIVARALSKRQSITLTRAKLLKKINVPKYVSIMSKEDEND